MALDVTVPDPPSLSGPQPRDEYEAIDTPEEEPDDDYRRAEIAGILAEDAWYDAFEEWAAQTSLGESDFDVLVEYDLVEALDFYWDPASDQVGFRSPTLSDAIRRRLDYDDAAEIESELDSLGRIVSETLENDYLVRDEETFGFFADQDSEETFDYDDSGE